MQCAIFPFNILGAKTCDVTVRFESEIIYRNLSFAGDAVVAVGCFKGIVIPITGERAELLSCSNKGRRNLDPSRRRIVDISGTMMYETAEIQLTKVGVIASEQQELMPAFIDCRRWS
jgi:hypothetical protein